MKKILAIIMSLILVLSFASCSDKADETKETNSKEPVTSVGVNDETDQSSDADTTSSEAVDDKNTAQDEKNPQKAENTQTTQKPETNAESKPENNDGQSTEPNKEPVKPEAEAPKTVGNILLADFKAKASSSDVLSLAEALAANPVMSDIMAGAMEVEPGYLTGFDNNEITGFKSGAVFMPMIGTIPFVGYVFELENGADVSAFISNLKSSANLRWNICTTADEMVSGSVGNKVFFVMCPASFEQE